MEKSKTSKTKEWLEAHKTLFQFIKFTLISCLAGTTEIVLFLILNSLLGDRANPGYELWSFITYTSKGTMLATVISAIAGQVVSFLLNFKKNFKSTSNIWISAFGYCFVAFVVIFIINGWLCGVLTVQFAKIIHLAIDFDVSGLLAKGIVMFLSALFVFPMNKFVLMRDTKK